MHRRKLALPAACAALALWCQVSAAEEGVSREDERVRAALQKEFSFDYAEVPLPQVLVDIGARAGVEIVFDPMAIEMRGGQPVTWASKKSTAERALRWVTRLVDLEYEITDGAVFVSTERRLSGDITLKLYDIRDIASAPCGRRGPRVSFRPEKGEDGRDMLDEISLAELIRERIHPSEWAADLGTSVEEFDGLLVVPQRSEVHEDIERLLAELRRMRRRAVRVDVVTIDSPAEKAADIKALDQAEIATLIRRTPAESIVASVSLSMLDGHTAHTISGTKHHYIESKSLQWPETKAADRYHPDHIQHEVIPTGDEKDARKVVVIKTPTPPPAPPPPGEGKVVPFVGALLDGVLVEVTPRVQADREAVELKTRLVWSSPRRIPPSKDASGESIQKPEVDYSQLMTTARLPLGRYGHLGRMSVRRGGVDVPVDVFARVTLVDE